MILKFLRIVEANFLKTAHRNSIEFFKAVFLAMIIIAKKIGGLYFYSLFFTHFLPIFLPTFFIWISPPFKSRNTAKRVKEKAYENVNKTSEEDIVATKEVIEIELQNFVI